MKRTRLSLFWKLSLVFFCVATITAAVHTWAFIYLWRNFQLVSVQWLSWEVADALARDIRPLLTDPTGNMEAIEEQLVRFTLLHPGASAYIVNSQGRTLYSSSAPGPLDGSPKIPHRAVNMTAIREFLAHRGHPDEALFGTEPDLDIDGDVIFSAAPLALDGEQVYLYVTFSSMRKRALIQGLGDTSIVGGVVSLFGLSSILSTLAGIMLFFLLTRNIRSMTAIVRKFQHGDYSQRIDIKTTDEIGQHARAFNTMADTIAANIEELEQADQLRRELIANVTHDIQTPFTIVQAEVEAALAKIAKNELTDAKNYLEKALDHSENLHRLLSDLFELSKITADGYRVREKPFPLDELAYEVVARFEKPAKEKEIKLTFEAPEGTLLMNGDLRMMNRALSNLVENAVRYTEKNGSVQVRLARTAEGTKVSVQDTGIGIPDHEIPRIFERYFRSSTGRTFVEEGTGLGLAIAKKTIDLHHGSLHVESEVGSGTTFWFVMPKYSG